MKKEKRKLKDKVTKNQLLISIGVFLILFALIGMVNYTVVAQFFTYCIAFLFGTIGAYCIYLLILMYGISLIISKKARIKMSFVVGGMFLILLGILIIFANSTYSSETAYLTFNGVMLDKTKGDFTFGNCFKDSFSSFPNIDYSKNVGLIGLLLVCIINSCMSNIGSYVFGAVFIALGTVFVLLKYVIKFSKYLKTYIELLKKKQKIMVYKDAKDVEIPEDGSREVNIESNEAVNNSSIFNESFNNQPTDNSSNHEDEVQDNKEYSDVQNSYGLKKAVFNFDNFNNNDVNTNTNKNNTNNFENSVISNTNIDKNKEEDATINNDFYFDDFNDAEDEVIENNKEDDVILTPLYNPKYEETVQEPAVTKIMENSNYNPNVRSVYSEDDSGIASSFETKDNENEVDEVLNSNDEVTEEKPEVKKEIKPVHNEVKKEEKEAINEYIPKETNAEIRRKKIYIYPPLSLLTKKDCSMNAAENTETNVRRTEIINQFFQDFNLGAQVESFDIGPGITRFNISMDKNVTVRGFENKMDDLSKQLMGEKCRFISVVKGKTTSGIEIKNAKTNIVSFKEVLEDLPQLNKNKYMGMWVGFGKDISGNLIAVDTQKLTHLLVTGTSGSGKSVFLQTFLLTLLMRNTPDELKLAIVDPKMVEFSRYNNLPHLLCPVVNEADQALTILNKLTDEMNYRYSLMRDRDFSDIKDYNNDYCRPNNKPLIPNIFVILDEYGDLVDTCPAISRVVQTLSAKARACGIHLVIATQTPRTNIISGPIKNNFTTRIALLCASASDSINVIDVGGAEKLAGNGDMLLKCPLFANDGLIRIQGAFIENKEIKDVLEFIKNRYPNEYDTKFMECLEPKPMDVGGTDQEERRAKANEDMYETVKEYALENEYFSISKIVSHFGVGFNRGRKLFEALVEDGVVEKSSVTNSKGSRVIK